MRQWIVIGLFPMTLAAIPAFSADLTIVGEENPPYEFVENGKVVGIDIDVANAVLAKMDVKANFAVLPWVRAWRMVEEGAADAVLSTSRKAEREPFVIYPKEDMWFSEFVFFTQSATKKGDTMTLEAARDAHLKIGVIRGNSYSDAFWTVFPKQADGRPNAQLEEANDIDNNLRKLVAKHIDLFIISKNAGLYTAKLLGIGRDVAHYDNILFSKGYPMPFVVKSKTPDIKSMADKFEAGLVALKKSGEYQKILDGWLK